MIQMEESKTLSLKDLFESFCIFHVYTDIYKCVRINMEIELQYSFFFKFIVF